jgi:type I restriction enzyme S subunit
MTGPTKQRLKYVAAINRFSLPEDTDPNRELGYIDISAVARGSLVSSPEVVQFGDAPSRARRLVRPGDTIVSTVRTYLRAVWPVNLPTDDLVVSTGFAVISPGPKLDSRYLGWLAQSDRFIEDIVARSVGVSYPAINATDVGDILVTVPPLTVQSTIAGFLNRETARIDALVATKRRMIELMEQRWQAVMGSGLSGSITSASTTKGSLIPWLQRIPVGWREGKLNLVARLGSGHTPSRQHPEWWEDPTIPWITTGEVAQMRSDRIEYVTETREMISELGMANSSATLHPADTVVLCRTASAGYSAIMGRNMATSQDFATWTCGPLLRPRFLLLCLRVMRQDLMGRLAMGSTHQTIYMPDIESIKVPLPPVAEQEAIIAAVYSQLPTIDRSISILNRQVELLEERRQALITVVVNGELEIPGIAA